MIENFNLARKSPIPNGGVKVKSVRLLQIDSVESVRLLGVETFGRPFKSKRPRKFVDENARSLREVLQKPRGPSNLTAFKMFP